MNGILRSGKEVDLILVEFSIFVGIHSGTPCER